MQLPRAIRDGELSRPSAPVSDGGADQDGPSVDGDQIGLDDQCFIQPDSDAWRSAWSLTERLIEQMNAECQQRQCGLSVAIVTSGIQVNPDDELRRAYAARLGVTDLGYADRRLSRLGGRLGFPVFPLSVDLLDYAKTNDVCVHGFANTQLGTGHWNEHGHRQAAMICAREISKLLKPHQGMSRD